MNKLKPIRRSCSRLEPTTLQLDSLSRVLAIAHARKNHSITATLDILATSGYVCYWRRVRWTGGVGSYIMMRGGVMRILVSSTKSGYSGSKFEPFESAPSLFSWRSVTPTRRGFRYGWCIELR